MLRLGHAVCIRAVAQSLRSEQLGQVGRYAPLASSWVSQRQHALFDHHILAIQDAGHANPKRRDGRTNASALAEYSCAKASRFGRRFSSWPSSRSGCTQMPFTRLVSVARQRCNGCAVLHGVATLRVQRWLVRPGIRARASARQPESTGEHHGQEVRKHHRRALRRAGSA